MAEQVHQQFVNTRRNQILDAAAVIFAEKGYHQTTIRDIARQAGLADGTIYIYFRSKPELLLGIFERMRAAIIHENLPPAPEPVDLPTFIRTSLYLPLMAIKGDNFALFRIILSEMLVNEELRDLYSQQIQEPMLSTAKAYFEKHAQSWDINTTDAGLIVRAISGMILGLILEYIMGDTVLADRWEKLPGILTQLLIDGLRGKEA